MGDTTQILTALLVPAITGLFGWLMKVQNDRLKEARSDAKEGVEGQIKMAAAQIETAQSNVKLAGAIDGLTTEVRALGKMPETLAQMDEDLRWLIESADYSGGTGDDAQRPRPRPRRRS